MTRKQFLQASAPLVGGRYVRGRDGGRLDCDVGGRPRSVHVLTYCEQPRVFRVAVDHGASLELSLLPRELPLFLPWLAAWLGGGPLPAAPVELSTQAALGSRWYLWSRAAADVYGVYERRAALERAQRQARLAALRSRLRRPEDAAAQPPQPQGTPCAGGASEGASTPELPHPWQLTVELARVVDDYLRQHPDMPPEQVGRAIQAVAGLVLQTVPGTAKYCREGRVHARCVDGLEWPEGEP